jgi:hypothetical protein
MTVNGKTAPGAAVKAKKALEAKVVGWRERTVGALNWRAAK